MSELVFIEEREFRNVLTALAREQQAKGELRIETPDRFITHLVDVGHLAESTARQIIRVHSNLFRILSPQIVRVAGYSHDIGKINVGDPYHEVESAYMVLKEGEDLGLVTGGNRVARRTALKRIACCLTSDFALDRELGDESFPDGALYRGFVTSELIEKVNFLRVELSRDSVPLTINQLTSPNTLERQVVMYTDLTGENGMQTRLDEMIDRYENKAAQLEGQGKIGLTHYYRKQVELTRQLMSRFLATEGLIKQLID